MVKRVEVEPGVVVEMRGGKPIKGKLRRWSWSATKRAAFLDHLAATCNVTASAEFAGGVISTAYRMRRRDPEFAEQWQEALEQGYSHLEAKLLQGLLKPVEIPQGETAVPDMPIEDREFALRLLSHQKRAVKGTPGLGHPPLKRATEQEACDAILERLAILKARIDAGEA